MMKLLLVCILFCGAVTTAAAPPPIPPSAPAVPSPPIISTANRGPTSADDTNSGYAIGQIWENSCKGWSAKAVTSGQAQWTPLGQNSTPLGNATAATPTGLYGPVLLNNAYAGNAFEVTRSSDSTTKTVGFVAGPCGTQVANWIASDAFCAGTTCGISTLYDQSGNAYNLSQSTFSHMPVYGGSTINGFRAITVGAVKPANGSTQLDYLMTNSSIAISSQAGSVFMVGRAAYSAGDKFNTVTSFGVPGSYGPTTALNVGSFHDGSTTFGMVIWGQYSADLPGSTQILPSTSLGIWGATMGASSVAFYSNGFSHSLSALGGPTTYTGLTFGACWYGGSTVTCGDQDGNYDFLALVIYGSQVSSADYGLLQSAMMQFGYSPQLNNNIVVVGDSIAQGYTVSGNNVFAVQIQSLLSRPWGIYNPSIGGSTLANWISWFPTAVAPLLSASNVSVVIVQAGTNDINTGASAATVEGYQQSVCALAHAAGAKCVLMSISSSSASTGAAVIVAVNAWDLANWSSFADAYAPIGQDLTIGCALCYESSTYFGDTAIHLNAAGHTVEAMYIANAINGLKNLNIIP